MQRHRTTAAGRPYVFDRARDHTSYARRRHIFGPVRSLADEAREAGMPSICAGLGLLIVIAATVWFAIIALDPSPAPRLAAVPMADAVTSHSPAVEARSGEGGAK